MKREQRAAQQTEQIVNDTLVKLAKRQRPLQQLSKRQMRKWIAEKVIDRRVMKRWQDREHFSMLALGSLTGNKLAEIVPCGNDELSLRLTEAGLRRVEDIIENGGRPVTLKEAA